MDALSSLLAERDDSWQLVVARNFAATKYRYAFPAPRGRCAPAETIRTTGETARVTLYRLHGDPGTQTLGWAAADFSPADAPAAMRYRLRRMARGGAAAGDRPRPVNT